MSRSVIVQPCQDGTAASWILISMGSHCILVKNTIKCQRGGAQYRTNIFRIWQHFIFKNTEELFYTKCMNRDQIVHPENNLRLCNACLKEEIRVPVILLINKIHY